MRQFATILVIAANLTLAAARDIRFAAHGGPTAIKMMLREQERQRSERELLSSSSFVQQPLAVAEKFPAQYFRQPLDHFSETGHSFLQRYWVNTRHYKEGGPIFILDGGETSGEDRLPFLDTGIMDILPKATGGIGIVLEHRYYGTSVPVKNLTTDSLRWLNNDQSAADSAKFMANLHIDGISENITALARPWIYYGGSYAGARAAHMRVLYPDLVFGAIASSAVTHAALVYWEYFDLIRNYTEPHCRGAIEHTVATVDRLLGSRVTRNWVKHLFGLGKLDSDQDFVSVLHYPLGSWQAKNWDPEVGSTKFEKFCDSLLGHKSPHNETAFISKLASEFMGNAEPDVSIDTLTKELNEADLHLGPLLGYARFIRREYVSRCTEDSTVEECFGSTDTAKFLETSLDATWRLWQFQVCTEWGYFMTSPPDPDHPSLVSRLMTLDYVSNTCRYAYPPGEHFSVPNWPNITAVNALGDFDLAADRLAFIDGEIDPWRPATPHSDYASVRNDTTSQPFQTIPGGVHHWDENGLANPADEPEFIQGIHREEIRFVKEWLKEWKSKDTN